MCSGDLWSHHVTFPANAAYAAQYKDTMVAYMIYYVNVLAKQTTVSLYIRQALDLHLRHGPRKLGRASGAGHSLPGARPLDPLVHMFNPSCGTHV